MRSSEGASATQRDLGEVLVSEGKISPEQLKEALSAQREDPRTLGVLLLSMGYVSKADLAEALAKRLRLEYLEITERDVDRGAASLVDRRVLRKHGALPLRVEDGRLVVAMSDPTNFYALEDLAVDAGPEEKPIVKLVGAILQRAVGEGASDIHIEPRAKELTVRFRVDGVLREVMSVPSTLQGGVIARLKILGNLDIAERRVPQDGRFSVRSAGQKIDLRVASLPTVFGEKVVLRLLDTSSVEANLKKLGFGGKDLKRFEEIFRRPHGTILVTGPTGSGKSTTLYATLAELNSPEKNIITVEDPVEYRMQGINQIQVNSKAGLTFASGLRSILRADPDIVMIGEIRDFETAKISVEAALTGHLVLATLHTNDAPSAVARLTDMGVEPFLTASAVDCVIAQRLARRLCERCKAPASEITQEHLEALGFPHFPHQQEPQQEPQQELSPPPAGFHKPVGCERCGGTGYKGRVG
ncbi:MAG: Flp pilus assembly complex ATPase component TadA, partial [Actinobacteria bacterium]|nr:Flp pilus assembly complex ATPase component TadA [Actinomycetota bacterium]